MSLGGFLNSGIYCITNCVTGQVYVGSSQHIRKRWNSHKSALNKGIHENAYLQRSWLKYGSIAFDFTVLEHAPPGLLIEREQLWMTQYPCHVSAGGFNISPTAANCAGVIHSTETRAKISAIHKGRAKTEEHRRKIGEAHKGRTLPPEQREAIAASVRGWLAANPDMRQAVGDRFRGKEPHNKGKPISDEQRRKQSEVAKARYTTSEGRAHLLRMRELSATPEALKKLSEAKIGKKMSEEARRKMSAARTGVSVPSRGRPKTDEWKKAHSERLRGTTHVKAHSPKPDEIARWRAMREEGLSYGAIAKEVERSVKTVYTHLNK